MKTEFDFHQLYYSIRNPTLILFIIISIFLARKGHTFVYEIEPTLPEVEEQIRELEEKCQGELI